MRPPDPHLATGSAGDDLELVRALRAPWRLAVLHPAEALERRRAAAAPAPRPLEHRPRRR